MGGGGGFIYLAEIKLWSGVNWLDSSCMLKICCHMFFAHISILCSENNNPQSHDSFLLRSYNSANSFVKPLERLPYFVFQFVVTFSYLFTILCLQELCMMNDVYCCSGWSAIRLSFFLHVRFSHRWFNHGLN